MPSPIVNIKEIPGQMKKNKCYAVSLQNNEVRIFSDKNLILTIPTPVRYILIISKYKKLYIYN